MCSTVCVIHKNSFLLNQHNEDDAPQKALHESHYIWPFSYGLLSCEEESIFLAIKWKTVAETLAALAVFAQRYLCVPATSVSYEPSVNEAAGVGPRRPAAL